MKSDKCANPAGRPRCFCPDKALDRALEVFWKKGFDGTSLTDLTEAMGINRPSLYAAYGNKESLFKKAIERYQQAAMTLFAEAAELPTARAYVDLLLQKSAEAGTRPDRPRGCFLMQAANGSCGERARLGKIVAEGRAAPAYALRQRFERAMNDGELPPGTDADALARYFATVMQGMSAQAAAGATADDLRRVIGIAMQAWPARA